MPTLTETHDAALRALGRRLARRRLDALDARTRLVVLVLAVSLSAFVFWQVRIPLDGVTRAHGPLAALAWLGVVLLAFAIAGSTLAGLRMTALLERVAGPEWLALPLPAEAVARHLRAEARLPALAVAPLAAATLGAAIGLAPAWTLPLALAAFVAAWLEGTRLACAWSLQRAAARTQATRVLSRATRALVSGAAPPRRVTRRAPTWRHEPAWRALARLDALVTRRAGPPRARAALAIVTFALGLAAWGSGAPPLLARAQAFIGFALGCAALGAWCAWRASGDPPELFRPLPLGLRDAWRARATLAIAVAGLALAANVAFALPLPATARLGMLFGWAPPALVILALGLHLGLTLPQRSTPAENLYFGWLGVGVVASMMIPFLGWAVLLAGLVHVTRRLPRWWFPEIA